MSAHILSSPLPKNKLTNKCEEPLLLVPTASHQGDHNLVLTPSLVVPCNHSENYKKQQQQQQQQQTNMKAGTFPPDFGIR